MVPAKEDRLLLDLGTGCGVIALAMLLRWPGLWAIGLDIQEKLLQAAGVNAARLGLAGRFMPLLGDAGKVPFAAEGFDLAVCNPPYRQACRGRTPPSAARRLALFEGPEGVKPFCRAAAAALRAEGRLGLIYPAGRLEELFEHLRAVGLAPARIMPVRARESEEPGLVLLEAVKTDLSGCPKPLTLPPLILHQGQGGATRLHPQALAFCPEMARTAGETAAFLDKHAKTDVLQKPEDCAHG